VRVGDHVTWIVAYGEGSSDDFIETKLFRPCHFNRAVHWRSDGDPGNRARDVRSRHRLDQNGCKSDRVAFGRVGGDSLDELEELRRVHDRVRDR
jgi:hypothetical protein